MKILNRCSIPAALLCAALPTVASADTYTWNFSTPAGAISSAATLFDTTNSFSLVARGYTTVNGPTTNTALGATWGNGGGFNNNSGVITSHNLYRKNDGPGENGLGLDGLSSNEIQFASFIQLDFGALQAAGFTSLTMGVGSLQQDEGYFLWGSNTQGTPGTLLRTFVGTPEVDTFTRSGANFTAYRYYSVSANGPAGGGSNDCLIVDGLTVARVPTPATASLLALGGLAIGRRRR